MIADVVLLDLATALAPSGQCPGRGSRLLMLAPGEKDAAIIRVSIRSLFNPVVIL